MPVSSSSSSATSVRSWPWLVGAAVLALGVQAIFLLMPEPKSEGATDPEAPASVAAMDSTAFTLYEDATTLPAPLPADSTAALRADSATILPAADSLQRPAARPDSAAPAPAISPDSTELR